MSPPALAIGLCLAAAGSAPAATDVAAYRRGLEALLGDLRAGAPDVRDRAASLRRLGAGDTRFLEPCLAGPLGPKARRSVARCAAIVLDRIGRRPGPGTARKASDLKREEGAPPRRAAPAGETADAGGGPSILDRIADWIRDRLRDLARWLRRTLGGSPAGGGPGFEVSVAALWAIVAAVVVGAVAVLLLRRRTASAPPRAAGPAAPGEGPLAAAVARRPDEWLDRFDAHRRGGRLREAIRDLQLGCLAALYRRGMIAYARSRTNWDYVAALGPGSSEREALAGLTRVFERHWYGLEAAREADCAEAARWAGRILGGRAPGGAR